MPANRSNDAECRRLADALLPAALAAGRVQMSLHRTGIEVEAKSDKSPVTIADRQSEEIILEALARAAPGIPVIAEEAVTAGKVPQIGREFFLVDPLDGTKGYIRGEDAFTVNIAFIVDRKPLFGLLYAPALDDFYVTTGGAQTMGGAIPPSAEVDRIDRCGLRQLRTQTPDPHALRALTSQSHLNKATQSFLDGYAIVDRRQLSSSLKFGVIAKGEADLYPRVGPTSEWDTAAGHAVLQGAGGTVTRLDGTDLLYGNPGEKFLNPDFVAWARAPMPPTRNI